METSAKWGGGAAPSPFGPNKGAAPGYLEALSNPADTGSLHSIIFHDAIQLALAGCKFSWAAQVFKCFSNLGEPLPLIADAPITIDIYLLPEHFMRDRLASFDSLPQDPRLAPSAGVKLCTYHRWFGRPQNAACPSYWESTMGNAKLHRILSFRMGSHHLPIEEGRHFNQPRASRVCNLCNSAALGDERHMLLECPALAGSQVAFLFTLDVLFQRHEAAPLGQGPA